MIKYILALDYVLLIMQSDDVVHTSISIVLMQVRTDATMGHIGLFGMLQVCLVFLLTLPSEGCPMSPIRPLLSVERCLAMCGIVPCLARILLWFQTQSIGA